jgi:hypothetical protein
MPAKASSCVCLYGSLHKRCVQRQLHMLRLLPDVPISVQYPGIWSPLRGPGSSLGSPLSRPSSAMSSPLSRPSSALDQLGRTDSSDSSSASRLVNDSFRGPITPLTPGGRATFSTYSDDALDATFDERILGVDESPSPLYESTRPSTAAQTRPSTAARAFPWPDQDVPRSLAPNVSPNFSAFVLPRAHDADSIVCTKMQESRQILHARFRDFSSTAILYAPFRCSEAEQWKRADVESQHDARFADYNAPKSKSKSTGNEIPLHKQTSNSKWVEVALFDQTPTGASKYSRSCITGTVSGSRLGSA